MAFVRMAAHVHIVESLRAEVHSSSVRVVLSVNGLPGKSTLVRGAYRTHCGMECTYCGNITLRKLWKSKALIPERRMGFFSEEPSRIPPCSTGRANMVLKGPPLTSFSPCSGTLNSSSSTWVKGRHAVSWNIVSVMLSNA